MKKHCMRVLLVLLVACFMATMLAVPAMAVGPELVNVTTIAQLENALMEAAKAENSEKAYDIHIRGNINIETRTITVPKNVHLFVDSDFLFTANSGTINNYGVVHIQGEINANSSTLVNKGDGTSILHEGGKVRGSDKWFNGQGGYIDARGSWEVIYNAALGYFSPGRDETSAFVLRDGKGPNGYKLTPPIIIPTREGYHLSGWHSNELGRAWAFNTDLATLIFTDDGGTLLPIGTQRTLYAIWDEHVWDDGIVTIEPTCTEGGEKTFTCGVCGETRTEPIADLGHELDEGVVTSEPTCTVDGETTYTCQRDGCDHFETEVLEALGHDMGPAQNQPATCTEDGYDGYKECSRCDYTEGEVLEALGHDWSEDVTPPTCTEKGFTTHICANDSAHNYDDNYVDAHGHVWDKGVVTKAPTFEEEGEFTYTCTICGATRTEPIKALEWKPATKEDAYGTKVASSAQHYYPGDGVEFWWGFKGAYGLQSEDGILIIDESFFDNHKSLTIVVKSSSDIQFVMAVISTPGAYSIAVPKWAGKDGKVHNINMVWIRFDDE